MFRKLQRKILLLNMTLISVVMLFAFATVYATTWQSVQLENMRKLNLQAPAMVTNRENEAPAEEFGAVVSYTISADYSLSFSVEIDDSGNILNVSSIIDLPEELYSDAVETALAQSKNDGKVYFENKDWMYKIESSTLVQMINGVQTMTQSGRHILFLDVTESRQTMRNLLLTLSVVGILVLVAFYFTSLFFSRKAVKPIAEAWEKQKQFIADASHELKTPLSIINANRDALLENRHETIDSQIKWLDYIRIGTDRMASLIGQLLALAKMDDVSDAIRREDVLISELVMDMVRSMEAATHEKSIKLSFDIEPDILIRSDGEKISVIVSVLLDNAIKYCQETIDVELVKAKRNVCFTVRNDGGGISQEDLPRIFDRFYRGDKSRAGNDGHGLGLSIAKVMTEGLDGRISAFSRPGNTVFSVTLPI